MKYLKTIDEAPVWAEIFLQISPRWFFHTLKSTDCLMIIQSDVIDDVVTVGVHINSSLSDVSRQKLFQTEGNLQKRRTRRLLSQKYSSWCLQLLFSLTSPRNFWGISLHKFHRSRGEGEGEFGEVCFLSQSRPVGLNPECKLVLKYSFQLLYLIFTSLRFCERCTPYSDCLKKI